MEGIFKFQELLENQKKRKEKISNILNFFLQNTLKIERVVNFKIDFNKNSVVKVKIQEPSSIKYILLQNKNTFINEYKSIFKDDILIIS